MKQSKCGSNTLLFVNDKKFKNFKISIAFKTPLDKKTATLNSLLVKVLLDGCEKYPTKKEISMQLKKLYGSAMSANCIKKGFALCPVFEIDAIGETFSGEGFFDSVIDTFSEIILNPLLENGVFKSEYVEREKKVLKNDIESAVNDKRKYAMRRCLEITCGDNPYGVFELGDSSICDKITPEMLYDHYKYIITSCAYTVVVVGNFDESKTEKRINELCEKFGSGENFKGDILPISGEVKTVKEESDITQGKLSMCFKTDRIDKKDQYVWQVLNGIFGGGVSSKLFNNVREKMSLCYYASSSLNKNIGIISANAGIDFENFEKTVDAISLQLKDIADNIFTDEEFENVKIGIVNNLKMANDDIDLLSSYYMQQNEEEEIITPLDKAEKISNVKRELIPTLARQIKLETVYFLCGREEA